MHKKQGGGGSLRDVIVCNNISFGVLGILILLFAGLVLLLCRMHNKMEMATILFNVHLHLYMSYMYAIFIRRRLSQRRRQ